MAEPTTPRRPNVQSKEFRTFAASSVSLTINDNFAQLTLGIEIGGGPKDPEYFIQEEARVVMTAKSLKVLSLVLTSTLASYEKILGEIKLPPGKAEELQKMLQPKGDPTSQPPA